MYCEWVYVSGIVCFCIVIQYVCIIMGVYFDIVIGGMFLYCYFSLFLCICMRYILFIYCKLRYAFLFKKNFFFGVCVCCIVFECILNCDWIISTVIGCMFYIVLDACVFGLLVYYIVTRCFLLFLAVSLNIIRGCIFNVLVTCFYRIHVFKLSLDVCFFGVFSLVSCFENGCPSWRQEEDEPGRGW